MKEFRLGLGVVIVKENKILLGKRKGKHCPDRWAVPGGHVEFKESIIDCAKRETFEETGLEIKIRPFDSVRTEWYFTNNCIDDPEKHYIGLFLVADWASGEVTVKEPHKHESWNWTTYRELMEYTKPGCAWLPQEFFSYYRDKILFR